MCIRDSFLFLFVVVYVVPLAMIGGTCVRTAAALRRQAGTAVAPSTPYNTAIVVHKRDENRRKVRAGHSYIASDLEGKFREF